MAALGDPAPLGLLSFALTTAFLMYVDMGWVEADFKEMVWGYATWYGGTAQLVVGFFELFKGNTFGATAFASYGAFWLGWAAMYAEYREGTFVGPSEFETAEGFWLFTFGILTTSFWVITLRKNLCLVVVFGLLSLTFYLLAIATWSGADGIKKFGGYMGFATAASAFYTAFAEIFALEWGSHVLPGLKPLRRPDRAITRESIGRRITYDARSNTLLLNLHDLEVSSEEHVEAIRAAIAEQAGGRGRKVDVVVNYHGFTILPHLVERYRGVVAELQEQFYQSVHRYHTDLFGSTAATAVSPVNPHSAAELEGLVHQLQRENARLRGKAATTDHAVASHTPAPRAIGAASVPGVVKKDRDAGGCPEAVKKGRDDAGGCSSFRRYMCWSLNQRWSPASSKGDGLWQCDQVLPAAQEWSPRNKQEGFQPPAEVWLDGPATASR